MASDDEQPESFGFRRSEDINRAPQQAEGEARKRKAKELAGFFQRRGITHTSMQTMHPAILEHHWRSAGLKGPPSEETLKEVAKHMTGRAT